MNWLRAMFQRRTRPTNNSRLFSNLPRRQAGVTVNEDTAFSCSAYWCCVRVISETIAQMPWRVHQRTPTGQKLADQHPADRLLNRAPNSEQDAAVWRELMLRWCLCWGNAYCEIVRDPSFRPVALYPIDPWRVTPMRTADGLVYEVHQDSGDKILLSPNDVLHFRGLGDDLQGWSVIQYAARALGLAISQEDSMASQMGNGARLSGLLTPAAGGKLTPEKAKQVSEQWNAQNAGSRNHGKVYLMSEGLEYKSLSMPNTDAQLLESRQLSVVDICRFMRVPPHLAYDLSRATFSNITHQSLEFRIHTLGPWMVKFEQQVNRKLISQNNWNAYFSKINAEATLRMDPETRGNWYKTLRELGAISPNEIRELEDMDTLGPDGDVYLVPVNMQTLEKANMDEPEPQPSPFEEAEPEPEQEEELVSNGRD